ncbi:uncharacterized protein LOC116344806 isoform X2 [Contarinia nasturtii]|uniref:uncharacterized protein LOC116344806 isoform X2 n=1 Tax=Contarinia nasturtii TaxID=265458 RepID=UPI0012D443D7|nr:uncharacterized protein LOC116344806 isoform X2 [Contarinia nasturtii]
MTRLFSKSALVIAGFLYFGVYPSFQVNVSPKVDFVEDNKSEHVPPKIQGVRVIVDATKMNGGKMEDKTETIRIQTDGGSKQTVGIHTDITFELDDKKNDTKKTDGKNAESDEDDDSEVPVYRGTHTEGERNNFNRRYDPNFYMNQPNYHGTNDEDSYKYADTGAGTWVRFLPMANGGGWTTERSTISVWWWVCTVVLCTVWHWSEIISTMYM